MSPRRFDPAAFLVVVGLARNCAKSLRRDVTVLAAAAGDFSRVSFLVVESDSTDATPQILRELSEERTGFAYLSLGSLVSQHPLRTDRIAVCRNRYLDELRQNPRYAGADYVLIADLDGANRDLTVRALRSCWQSEETWDVCTANQSDAYYDIWALRHASWCPVDCWEQYRQLRPLFGHEQALSMAIHSRMVQLSPQSDWIEVDSAFGGLALYKREALLAAHYCGLDAAGVQVCEHVPFHAQLRQQGFRIFINPKLINANRTAHSARKRLHVRLRRKMDSLGKRLRSRVRGALAR